MSVFFLLNCLIFSLDVKFESFFMIFSLFLSPGFPFILEVSVQIFDRGRGYGFITKEGGIGDGRMMNQINWLGGIAILGVRVLIRVSFLFCAGLRLE